MARRNVVVVDLGASEMTSIACRSQCSRRRSGKGGHFNLISQQINAPRHYWPCACVCGCHSKSWQFKLASSDEDSGHMLPSPPPPPLLYVPLGLNDWRINRNRKTIQVNIQRCRTKWIALPPMRLKRKGERERESGSGAFANDPRLH